METNQLKVPVIFNGTRLDIFLYNQLKKHSRNFYKTLIEDGFVQVNNKVINKSSYKVKTDDKIVVQFPDTSYQQKNIDIEIEVVYQNNDFLILNKPAGLSVHPSSYKDKTPTLIDWLLKNYINIKNVGLPNRPGIVHRLDKNTSGIMIVALNTNAYKIFTQKFKNREIKKTYLALVKGHPDKKGEINFKIERAKSHKNKMAHSIETGREAKTFYKVLEFYKDTSLLEVTIVTGRTHQIRVHMAAIGYPIIGDVVYGGKSKFIKRQSLHAHSLKFEFNGKEYNFEKDIPEDFNNLLQKAKSDFFKMI